MQPSTGYRSAPMSVAAWFPHRLVEERRIGYKKFGSHVRIAERVLDAYIESYTVWTAGMPRSNRRFVAKS